MADNHVTILLAEDDDVDAEILSRTMNRLNVTYPVIRVADGLQILKVLRDSADTEQRFLILLDMNMPRMNGIEFLEEYGRAPKLHQNMVLVLSNLDESQFDLNPYRPLINGYLTKGNFQERFVDELTKLQL
ncbi:response regulator [bacterium]|nr:response regulator [bacterium]